MTQKKYKVGVIGCGGFGSFCIEAYNKMPEIEVLAICRTHKTELKKCAKKFQIPLTYTDYKELLKNPKIDIVLIATPPFLHTEQAIAAARAGKHLVLEKPLALTLKDADKVIETINKNSVKSIINYVMRYNPIYEKIKEETKKKFFGELQEVNFENYAKTLPEDHWFWDEKRSGGILIEHGVHFFDIFGQIIDSEPVSFKTEKGNKKILTALKYKNGVLASFFHAFDKPYIIEKSVSRLSYERGYIEISGWIPLKLRLEGLVNGRVRREITKLPYTKKELYQKNIQEIMRDLIKSVENPKYKPRISLKDARESLRVALLATKAVES